jgi:hypothetical protein
MKEDNMRRGVRQAGLTGAIALAVVGVASLAVVASTGPAPEDDLTVVKRAVAQATPAPAAPAARAAERAAPEEKTAEPRPRASGKEPTWLKVRVTDKETGRRKVTVNLPLALVRAVGNGWPRIDFDCGEQRARCGIKISEVLAALESGQDLVEIEEEHESVKVWVE